MNNYILNSGSFAYGSKTYNYVETNNHYNFPYVFKTDSQSDPIIYVKNMSPYGSGAGVGGSFSPDGTDPFGPLIIYYDVKAYGIATITEAAEIGGMTGVSNNKCIIKNEVENYGCKIKEGAEYDTNNRCIKYVDLEKKESNLYYCSFTALEDNSAVFFRKKTTMSETTQWHLQFSYNGETWRDVTNNIIIDLNTGQTVYIRQNADDYGPARGNMSTSAYYSFGMGGSISGGGYISSLIDGENSNSTKSLPSDAEYIFYKLFSGCTALTESPIINYTDASYHGYEQMFDGCTSLSKVETYQKKFLTIDGTVHPQATNKSWLNNVKSTDLCVLTVHQGVISGKGIWDNILENYGYTSSTCPLNWCLSDPDKHVTPGVPIGL